MDAVPVWAWWKQCIVGLTNMSVQWRARVGNQERSVGQWITHVEKNEKACEKAGEKMREPRERGVVRVTATMSGFKSQTAPSENTVFYKQIECVVSSWTKQMLCSGLFGSHRLKKSRAARAINQNVRKIQDRHCTQIPLNINERVSLNCATLCNAKRLKKINKNRQTKNTQCGSSKTNHFVCPIKIYW